MAGLGKFIAELRRRNVLRAGVLYIGAVWALAQGIAQLTPVVGAPEWVARWFLVAAVIGFPFWLAFAWFYEFTPEGLKRESEITPAESITAHTGKKLDRWIFAVMGIAIVLLLTNTFVWHKGAGLSADADSVPIPEHSIAVLPFVNMSSDKEQEYFSDGISEELLNLLAKIPQLQVTARTSSFSFKGKEVAIPEIARTLHVAHVLEGSVRKSGNSVRITAQLIKAGTDTHLWSQTYDRKLDDIFAIQDEIAADVVKQLKITLLGAAPAARKIDPKAYPLYLQAVQLDRQGTAAGYDQAEELLKEAVRIDPGYASAWDQLAFVYQARGFRDFLPRRQAYRRAREFIAKALEADPNFATAYGRLGEIAGAEGDLQVAAEEVRRALTIEPKNTIVLAMASSLLVSLNRNPEAIAVSEYLLVNDPVNPIRLANTADSYVAVGRYADAIATCKTVLTLTPGRPSAQSHLVAALLLSGRGEEAREVIKEVKNEDVRREMNAMVEHLLGRKPQSDAGLASLISDYAKKTDDDDRADAAFRIARVLAFRGDSERAFEWLAKLEAAPSSTTSLAYDPYLKGLHDDPRWLALLRRLGRAPEQLAEIEFKVTLPQAVAEPQSNTSQQAR